METLPSNRIRLPDGRFTTRRLFQSSAVDIEKASPEEIWTSKDWRRFLVREMETRHLANVVQMILRKADEKKKKLFFSGKADILVGHLWPVFKTMRAELDKRLGMAKKKPTQKVERFIELE